MWPRLHPDCTQIAPSLHPACTQIAPRSHPDCTQIAPRLQPACTGEVPLPLHYRCVPQCSLHPFRFGILISEIFGWGVVGVLGNVLVRVRRRMHNAVYILRVAPTKHVLVRCSIDMSRSNHTYFFKLELSIRFHSDQS